MARDADRRRVVVTGMGCVSPLGADLPSTWEAVAAGRSGVRALSRFEEAGVPVRLAATCAEEIPLPAIPERESRRFDRGMRFALAAAAEALADAALDPAAIDRDRAGVAVGNAIGGIGTLLTNQQVLLEKGARRISPFVLPMALGNMPSGYVAMQNGFRGPNLSPVGACASGAQAIGEAARIIERGDADVMLAGGSEAALMPLAVAGFAAMRALSKRSDEPERASRPFDRERDGFVMAEGGAVLLLEAAEHAVRRDARVRAELLGYGSSADALHLASPDDDGSGAALAMQRALDDAGLGAAGVDHLNAHATGTPAGDRAEARAIGAVFGTRAGSIPVSATKSMTGHLFGAAGALEAILTVRALETGVLPPTINLDHPDPECELDHVANKARECAVRVAMSNSFGFGGINASLVLGRGEVEWPIES